MFCDYDLMIVALTMVEHHWACSRGSCGVSGIPSMLLISSSETSVRIPLINMSMGSNANSAVSSPGMGWLYQNLSGIFSALENPMKEIAFRMRRIL